MKTARSAHRTLACVLFLTVFALAPALSQQAKPNPKPAAVAEASEKKARPIPFHGTISAVNQSLRTLTVGKRTFVIASDTKLYKEEKTIPGLMKDAVVGGRVTGSYVKEADGRLVARSIYFKGSATPTLKAGAPGASSGPSVGQKK